MRYVSTLFACSLLSVGFAQVPEYVPAEGLVAWYPFNGNAQDESGNGHHAAIDGATLADDRYGNFDAAFYFDGSDRIIAPQNVSPLGNSARTINAFFKSYTALPVGNNQYSLQAIFGSGSAASGKVISTLNIDGSGTNNGHIPRTGHLYFSSGSWQDEAWSQTSVSDSLWHMATMTYEGANTPVRVYLDGQFQDQTDPITLNTHLSDFYIGDVPWAVLFFNGLIDDLGVWNRALTDEEILALLGPEIPSGCTDTDACNFNDDAVVDDGSCIPSGCTDSYACNFDAESGCDDGSCDYSCCPGPGCCDVGMHWDWELGMCQITNVADTNLDGCVQLNDLLDVLSAYGNCGTEELQWQCGDPLEYQSYNYETVQIGEQCWFADNLRNEQFRNGDIIQTDLNNSSWFSINAPAMTIYGLGSSQCDSHSPLISACNPDSSLAEYGRLYNWYAVVDERGLCPSGWHEPSDEEWMELELQLGINADDVWFVGTRGNDQGFRLKTNSNWYGGNNGDNSLGFSAKPSGYRHGDGMYLNEGKWGGWWTSSSNGQYSWYRHVSSNFEGIHRGVAGKMDGFPVRCLQDSQ